MGAKYAFSSHHQPQKHMRGVMERGWEGREPRMEDEGVPTLLLRSVTLVELVSQTGSHCYILYVSHITMRGCLLQYRGIDNSE